MKNKEIIELASTGKIIKKNGKMIKTNNIYKCEVCGGSGLIGRWIGSPRLGTLECVADDCPKCKGEGRII